MMRASIVSVAAMFFLPVTMPASAQQTQAFSPSVVKASPLVEQMLGTTTDGDRIVELKGHVGPSTRDTVRLYADLSLTRYFEIPRSAIVSMVQDGDPNTGL
jgi:hypothetical protein